MPDLAAVLLDALADEEPDADDFDAILDAYDDDAPTMAAVLADTTDKRSLAYKAALRNVERWRQGTRTPNRASRVKLARAARHAGTDKYRDGMHVEYDGCVLVSKDCRERHVEFVIPEGPHPGVDGFLDAYDAADYGRCVGLFLAACRAAYGVPFDLVDDCTDCEASMELILEPA